MNLHLQALEAAGLLGMVADEHGTTVYLDRRSADLSVDGRWEHVPDQDWNAAWKAGIEPVIVGAVTVTPPWSAAEGRNVAPGPPGSVVVVIEPAQAFGTGHHETTTGCLAALQELELGGARVLEVGTGTGVLAIAAAGLGAAEVVAVDTDPVAVAAAVANAVANGAAVDVRLGSAAVAGSQPFDVVVANLDTDTLTGLAADLAGLLSPGGTLVASGVGIERAGQALTALEAAGLSAVARPGREWVVLTAWPRRDSGAN
ncbi:MAG: 50S ribosomal protein L11 methyltransferase [Egibacteraceae bacterium]